MTAKYCKGICNRFSAPNHVNGGLGLYSTGHKRCNTCEVYLKTEEKACPCCNNQLRNRPRNSRYKEKFRKYVQEVNT